MKEQLTKLCWPILKFFETEQGSTNFKKSHRMALNAVAVLFLFLSVISAVTAHSTGGLGSLIPVLIFFCAGTVALIVGSLGSNNAVSKIWGTK